MKSFDLHCDTIGECYKKSFLLRKNELHLDLERCKAIGEHTQVFAIWIPDELRGDTAFSYFNNVTDFYHSQINENDDLISYYNSDKKTPVKSILAMEGASGCGGSIKGLHSAYEKGVRLITLTWNANNEIGGGAFADGGITPYGKEFIKEAENLGIVLDVSHLNRESFFDFIDISSKPFVASHSNIDIVNTYKSPKRNLTKEQVRLIKERDGIIGINFYVDFIEDENAVGFEAIERQLDAFLEMNCEDVISLGSDYDGCRINPLLSSVEKLTDLYNWLNNKGYNESLLNKLFYQNAENFFKKINP